MYSGRQAYRGRQKNEKLTDQIVKRVACPNPCSMCNGRLPTPGEKEKNGGHLCVPAPRIASWMGVSLLVRGG